MSQAKVDEIKIKANILRAFVEKKAEEAKAETEAENVARDTAEL